MSKPTITTQRVLRQLFWRSMREANPTKAGFYPIRGYSQNDYPADTRMAFCEFVENMNRDGIISESLAQRSTL